MSIFKNGKNCIAYFWNIKVKEPINYIFKECKKCSNLFTISKEEKEFCSTYCREKYQSDKLLNYYRSRIWQALRGNKKYKHTEELIGCSIKTLKQHLENQFQDGMSWENYGMWHVDHIKPCASFNLSKPEEQFKCFHYSNLQPLWAFDNFSKGAK